MSQISAMRVLRPQGFQGLLPRCWPLLRGVLQVGLLSALWVAMEAVRRHAGVKYLQRAVKGRQPVVTPAVTGRRPGSASNLGSATHALRPVGQATWDSGVYQYDGAGNITNIGSNVYVYDPLHYLVVSMTVPMLGQVIEATPEKPYLCLRLDIDPEQIADLIMDTEAAANGSGDGAGSTCAAFAARVTPPLLDAVLRLMRLLDDPADLRILGSMAMREIFYRVLLGDLGHQLRDLAVRDSGPQRIAKAVEMLRQRYLEPLRIETLARSVHMSISSLHHNFKAATTLSPLQYQKQLRLHEARRLMLAEGLEAATAAHRVGYESPSQFSREYKRLFGAPPRSEISQVRLAAR